MIKKIFNRVIFVLAVLCILASVIFVIFLFKSYFTYIDTHTWATVTARTEVPSNVNETYELTQEYLQGETITMGNVTVIITDISTGGTVDMKVQSGNLYNSNGDKVKKFTINLDEQAYFTTDEGTLTFWVDSNRYE